MTKTALAYLRVSGAGQVNGDGLDRQRTAVNAYAASVGLDVAGEYEDRGISGTAELANREGLAALIDRTERDGIGVIIIERADRLARDAIISEVILRQFRSMNIRVVSAESGVDLTAGDASNPTAKLIRQVLASVSEFEKDVIVQKLRTARNRRRRENGKCEGRKAYGERPGESAIIERIHELRRKRPNGRAMSARAIAETLNAEGCPTRTGTAWHHSVVSAVLKRGRRGG